MVFIRHIHRVIHRRIVQTIIVGLCSSKGSDVMMQSWRPCIRDREENAAEHGSGDTHCHHRSKFRIKLGSDRVRRGADLSDVKTSFFFKDRAKNRSCQTTFNSVKDTRHTTIYELQVTSTLFKKSTSTSHFIYLARRNTKNYIADTYGQSRQFFRESWYPSIPV